MTSPDEATSTRSSARCRGATVACAGGARAARSSSAAKRVPPAVARFDQRCGHRARASAPRASRSSRRPRRPLHRHASAGGSREHSAEAGRAARGSDLPPAPGQSSAPRAMRSFCDQPAGAAHRRGTAPAASAFIGRRAHAPHGRAAPQDGRLTLHACARWCSTLRARRCARRPAGPGARARARCCSSARVRGLPHGPARRRRRARPAQAAARAGAPDRRARRGGGGGRGALRRRRPRRACRGSAGPAASAATAAPAARTSATTPASRATTSTAASPSCAVADERFASRCRTATRTPRPRRCCAPG